MAWSKELIAALEADGDKLHQLTGEDHGPWVPVEEPCGHPDCEFPTCGCERIALSPSHVRQEGE